MSMTVDEILDRQMDEIEEPKNPPVGTWFVKVTNAPKVMKSKGSDPRILYVAEPVAPTDDVSPLELDEVGDAWEGTPLFFTFWLNDKRDEHKHKMFVQRVFGIDTAGLDTREVLAAVKGAEAMAEVGEEYDDNGDARATLVRFAPLAA